MKKRNRNPFESDKEFIVTWLLGALFIALLSWFVIYGYSGILNAAYDASSVIVK